MGFFDRLKREGLPRRLLALAVLVVAACGGGSSSQENSATSALSFQVVWDRPDFQKASLTDCADVATVGAAVYSEAGDLLGEGGPWDCLTGSGVISGLPANYYATIAVTGYSPDGAPLYYGQSGTPIFLNPGSVDGGVITAGPFVPELLSPNDAAIVAPFALELRWARLAGAAAYRVTLAASDTFAAETLLQEFSVDGAITSVLPDVTGLQVDQPYYWRMVALSASGRTSAPSTARQFSLREVAVTGVTFVGDDPAGVPEPVQTTVTFSYATIDFSQEQNGAVIAQWSAPMDSNDYFALQEIITSYELMAQPDITYTPAPCAGWSGLAVSMVYNATTYGFTISSAVCNPSEWPSGVSSLVTLKDDWVAKYQP